jgi:TPR repeat protein
MNAPQLADTWRVAALTMMRPEELRAILGGDEAAPWVQAAAACGIPEAQIRLGRLLLEGRGVMKDAHAAFACFVCAARMGDAEAENMLGRCFENGWGTVPDVVRATEHYRIAAEAGLAWAQYNLGHMLLNGNGVTRDRDQAFAWYMRAATQGHERAMNLAARCFEEGWGTERSALAARHWYRKSAAGGYFRGAYNYATILAAEGCITGALIWFDRAIEQSSGPTRATILSALSHHAESRIRALARRVGEPLHGGA